MNPMKELTPDLLQEFSRSYAQKDGAQTLGSVPRLFGHRTG